MYGDLGELFVAEHLMSESLGVSSWADQILREFSSSLLAGAALSEILRIYGINWIDSQLSPQLAWDSVFLILLQVSTLTVGW